MAERDDFFIGYSPQMPDELASFVRRIVVALGLIAVGVGVALALLQRPFPVGFFEFGVTRPFTGVVERQPYPLLWVDPPGRGGDPAPFYLVAPGKHGAEQEIEALAGQRVELEGSLIYRQGQTMIEIAPGSPRAAAGGTAGVEAAARPLSLGRQTLIGEIVDSKCHLGLMKPGDGKPHRGCASLCIRGGIPPLFAVGGATGPASHLLLVDSGGEAVNQRVLAIVAEPLEITGEVVRLGDLWMLRADPETYRRLAASP